MGSKIKHQHDLNRTIEMLKHDKSLLSRKVNDLAAEVERQRMAVKDKQAQIEDLKRQFELLVPDGEKVAKADRLIHAVREMQSALEEIVI